MSSDCGDCRKRRHQERVRASIPRPFGNCTAPGCDEPMAKELWPLCFTHAVTIYTRMKQSEEVVEAVIAQMCTPAKNDRNNAIDAHDAKIRGTAEGFVYYLRVGDRIKIGYSVDVRQRMRAYPPDSELLAVEPGSLALERERHQQFAGQRAAGREWFRPCPEIEQHAAELVAAHGSPARFSYRYRTPSETQAVRVRSWRGRR